MLYVQKHLVCVCAGGGGCWLGVGGVGGWVGGGGVEEINLTLIPLSLNGPPWL